MVYTIINILCIPNGKVFPIKFASIEANNKSKDNRIYKQRVLHVKDFDSYIILIENLCYLCCIIPYIKSSFDFSTIEFNVVGRNNDTYVAVSYLM
ncbi:hypothetical protein K6025_00800 [Ehrlichia sp. JZT12]